MNNKNTLEDFGIGDQVNVEAMENDAFNDFTGRIIGRRGNFFVIEDQEEEAWDCLPEQVSVNTDDIMHD
jgi:hypothetical protein